MKTSSIIFSLLALIIVSTQAQIPSQSASAIQSTVPAPTEYQVVNRGANRRVWQRQTYEKAPNGKIVTHVHSYTELATGLHYKDAGTGQWLESQELIESFPGGAVARQGQQQVIFANNLNSSGAVDMQTPDGKRLRSNILGLMYVDTASGNAVMIAQLQDSQGQLISANQVLYTNAFVGVNADVRYTYKKGGFEQDVILREQPPAPNVFGMNPDATVLEVVTEFINPPPATVTEQSGATDDQIDDTVAWGMTTIGRGKAFDLSDKTGLSSRVSVHKRYLNIQGRKFLLERVRLKSIRPQLNSLPVQASARSSLPTLASKQPLFPKVPLARLDTKPMKLAVVTPADKGYVLDYVIFNSNQTNFTFQGNMTYYVSGEYTLSGTTTIEGGAVVKMNGSGQIDIAPNGTLDCQTASYRPAIFTSINDNSIGEWVSGSSGTPAMNDVFTYLYLNPTNVTVHDIFFRYGVVSISHNWGYIPSWLEVWNCQFVNGEEAVYGYSMKMLNVLIGHPGDLAPAIVMNGPSFSAENVTVDKASGTFIEQDYYPAADIAFTNCLITANNLIIDQPANIVTNSTIFLTSTSSPAFQSVGAADYYLADSSPYRDVGTTDINPTLLAALSAKTTYPPIVYSNLTITATTNFAPQAQRDSDGSPDLGYHYDPLDYVFGGVDASANLTFTAGTAVGWFELPGSYGNGYGISASNGVAVTFNGTVTSPCYFARYNSIQAGGNGLWQDVSYPGGIVAGGSYNPDTPSKLVATFTLFSHPAAASSHFRDYLNIIEVQANNTEFYGGFGGYDIDLAFTNCLIYCADFWQGTADSAYTWETYREIFRNCTFHGGSFGIVHWEGPPYWKVSIRNCAFDGTSFDLSPPYDYSLGNWDWTWLDADYNAFYNSPFTQEADLTAMPGASNVYTASFNWQTSWLGDFYLPPDSPLIDAGDMAANQAGLYHFTTQTNQMLEINSPVDIGYHYVAMDDYVYPLDDNIDGIPDYQQDYNGNGIVDGGETPWMALPVIVSQPANQTVPLSSNATFSVIAAGVALNYQWYSNTAPILNATNATLILNSVQTNSTGSYYVAVSNPAGSTFSLAAILLVVVPPTIITQPQPVAVSTIQGTTAGFGVTIAGTSPFYQWFFNGTNAVPGATNMMLTLTSVQSSSAGNYSVVVSNLAGVVISSNAILTVSLPPLSWLQQYYGLSYQNNTNATATADPDGDGINNLQEYLNGSNPNDYYNGVLPSLSIISGNSQTGQLNAFLPQSLVIQVLRSGLPLTNAPITFGVTNGINLLAISTNGSALSPSVSLQTDTNGYASVWLYLPANSPASISVNTTAQSGTNIAQVTFTASANAVATPVVTPNGGTFAINKSVTLSCMTTGATMYYTLNGKVPTEADLLATNNQMILIQGGCQLMVRAFEDGVLWPSAVASTTFGITGAIAAGYNHTLALKYDGSVWAAGTNGNGRLGDGTTNSRVNLVGVTNLTGVTVAVEAGAGHSLALEADGTVRAWGLNNNGQLGNNSLTNQFLTNVMVFNLTNVLAIAAGGSNNLALLANGTVRAWGYNTDGELGDNTTTSRRTNVTVLNLSNVVAIAAGGSHGLALLTNGTVRAWGLNSNGQLGDNTTTQRNTNVLVTNLTSVTAISAGSLFSLAVLNNSTVRAWGNNTSGQLGDGTTTDRRTNVVVTGLSNVVAVAAGGFHSLALLSNGTVRAWGTNNFGQLGDGSTNKYRLTNVAVIGISNIVAIAAGSAHSVALRSDGAIFVWGYTNYGLSGGFSSTPVLVQPTNHLTYWAAPSIVNQPQTQTVNLGGNANLEVGTVGTTPMSYQWYSNSIALMSATNSTLVFNNIQTNATAGYSVTISNPVGSTTSITATLTVSVPQTVIIMQPTNVTVMAGSSASMSVVASGAMPLNYQWYCLTTGLIPGATNTSLTLLNVQTNNTDLYYVIVTNIYASSATSLTAALTVIDPTTDADGNGLPDSWELKNFGHTGVNPNADPDGDYLSNLQEYQYGTNPNNADSDGDGRTDWQEIVDGTDPLNTASYPTWPMAAYQPLATSSGSQGIHPLVVIPSLTTGTANGINVYWVVDGVSGVKYNVFAAPTLTGPWTYAGTVQSSVNGVTPTYNLIQSGMDTYFYTLRIQSVVTIAATDATASEIGPDMGTYRITRTGGDQSGQLTVNYTIGGTATDTSDYQHLTGSVTILANVDHVDITVTPVLNANTGIANKTVVLTLQMNANHDYAIGAASQATVNIIDAYGDTDGDGLADMVEASFGTIPSIYDDVTHDGIPDWREDSDNDGIPNSLDSSPTTADSAPSLPPGFNKCSL